MVHKYELKMRGVSLSCPIVSGCHASYTVRVVTRYVFSSLIPISDPYSKSVAVIQSSTPIRNLLCLVIDRLNTLTLVLALCVR